MALKTHHERPVDIELKALKQLLITMANHVQKAIESATFALQHHHPEKLQDVFEHERSINQLHIQIDGDCLKLLALHQPLAKDLRFIFSIIKINTDLERMGDQAVNIAKNTEKYLQQPTLKPLIDLPLMFEEVKSMIGSAIQAFIQKKQILAREVLTQDDRVDQLKHQIFREVIETIKVKPDLIEPGLTLILIARNLERLGDHATNIAEDVIFAITGKDIRHPEKKRMF